ncbi:MAG: hypothetical protein NWS37_01875 [Flavobacteriaceae bacterium]|nr:hypothetical protein [Flavobacteriaceae bacterium]
MKIKLFHSTPKFILGIFLSISLMAPSLIELGHLVVHQKHQLCHNESKAHLHDGNDNCQLLNYHFNQKYQTFGSSAETNIDVSIIHVVERLEVQFESCHKVYRLKRGPPYLA